MGSEKRLVLMDSDRIRRSFKRMAHEIVEKNSENRAVLFWGIDERGYAVALALADILRAISVIDVEVLQLPLKHGSPLNALKEFEPEKVQDKYLIVVDDVIFSGKTMFEALKKISESLKPIELHTAVMVDRGHRKFPIKAEFYGMELPTKLNEHVSVVVDGKNVKKVLLENLADE